MSRAATKSKDWHPAAAKIGEATKPTFIRAIKASNSENPEAEFERAVSAGIIKEVRKAGAAPHVSFYRFQS